MSSKTNNKKIKIAVSPYRAFWSSIIGRLTILYTLSASGILVISTVFLYRVLVSSLETEDNEFIDDKIHVLQSILLKNPYNLEAISEQIKWEGTPLGDSQYYIRVLDEKGNTLIETPGMGNIVNPSSFPHLTNDRDPPKEIKWRSPKGRAYLLKTAWAETASFQDERHPKEMLKSFGFDVSSIQREKRLFQIALDVSDDEALVANYRRKFLTVLLLGVLSSAAAGVIVASKGMHPLKEITKAAQRIKATQLHERISPTRWPNELTELATAFDEMLDRLENSFNQLSQFSADLAHELRTPINNLMGETEVALSRTRTPDEYRHILESSLEEYGRLSRMIDSLLFLARAESRDAYIKRSLFNAFKEIKAVQEFHESVAEEQGIEVTCQGNALLNADPILFRRAVSNLLSNALQHTPRGGKVTLSVKQTGDEYVEVSVSDTGSGIDPEHLPRIFDRFYRADRARSQHPQGAGLGLAIVKSIMDLHGGTVTIESKPNEGTIVILRFPNSLTHRITQV
jgi:two-component system heavy metal sensor histidine kinase CusS